MSEVTQRTNVEVEEIAKNLGLKCFLPGPDEIQIDLDKGELNERVLKVLAENGLTVVDRLETTSKEGKKHVYLKFSDHFQSLFLRLVIQACLGSDPVREVLSAIRGMHGSESPVALFETKLQAIKVNSWRDKYRGSVDPAELEIDDDVPY